jgi:hypothetical protein
MGKPQALLLVDLIWGGAEAISVTGQQIHVTTIAVKTVVPFVISKKSWCLFFFVRSKTLEMVTV